MRHSIRYARRRQSGIAIITVLLAVATAVTLGLYMTRSTIVDSFTARANTDRLRAEYLARSAMNLAESNLRLQSTLIDGSNTIKGAIGTDNILSYSPELMCLFSASVEEKRDLGGGIEGLMATTGEMKISIVPEDGKINLNCAGKANSAQRTALHSMLSALVAHPAYDTVFQNADATGWRRDRKQQVDALVDFIDQDGDQFSQPGSAEQYGYGRLDDPYLAHDNYLDTLLEARLIRGVDNAFWTLFGDEFTIYGDCKVNIAAVSSIKVIGGLLLYAAKNPQNEPVLQDQVKFWKLAASIHEVMAMPTGGGSSGSTDLKCFVNLAKNPLLPCDGAASELMQALMQDAQLEPVEGITLDINKLRQVASEGPRRAYRVKAEGIAPVRIIEGNDGYIERVDTLSWRIEGIWDTKYRNLALPQNQNATTDPNAQPIVPPDAGAWVYWRED